MLVSWSRLRSSLTLLCGLALVALVAAGCGSSSKSTSTPASSAAPAASTSSSSSSSGSSSVSALAASLKQYTTTPTTIAVTKPVGKPIPTGKTIAYVNCGQPACTAQDTALEAAAKVLGWKVTTINATPTPQGIQNAFAQALRDKPDAVDSAGFAANQYPQQVAAFKAAKIPVLSASGTDATGTNGITLQVGPPSVQAQAAKIMADQALVNAGGKGTFAAVLLTGYPILLGQEQAWTAEIKAKCPSCTEKTLTLAPTAIGTTAAGTIANFLRANPGVKGMLLTYDLLGEGLKQAVAGASGTYPDTYSWAPDEPGRQALANGQRTASIPDDYINVGWQTADALARIFTGQSIAADSGYPRLVLWSSEYKNVPTPAAATPVIIPNYQAQYEKLWGK